MISYDDFKKLEIKAGRILSAEKIPDTDKLLRLMVDFGLKLPISEDGSLDNLPITENSGERDVRQIVSGIAPHFPYITVLVGKNCMFVTNLEPRVIRGHESDGMILAVSATDGFSLLEPNSAIPPGTRAT